MVSGSGVTDLIFVDCRVHQSGTPVTESRRHRSGRPKSTYNERWEGLSRLFSKRGRTGVSTNVKKFT